MWSAKLPTTCGGGHRKRRRDATLLRFGGIEQIKEDCRDARGTRWVETMLQDIRFASRSLRKSSGFAIGAVCTLALGIGANTAIFSVINGVILRPLPYRDPARLVAVQEQLRASGQDFAFSYPDFLDCKRASHSFEKMAAWRNFGMNVTSPGEPEYVCGRQVSAGFLSVLGIKPLIGREFRPREDQPGAAPVAMIGYSLWRSRFGGRIAGGKSYTLIGVLPANFRFFSDSQVFTPIGQSDNVVVQKRDMYAGLTWLPRLKPGVTLKSTNSELKAIGMRLAREYPETNQNMTFGAETLKQQVVGEVGTTLFLLAGAVALVLLIACANVANLFLARSVSRTREFAIRAALGAGRGRLIRQLLTESVLLSLIGGGIGLAVAGAATRWALRQMPDWLPRTEEVSIDGRVLIFTFAASLATGMVFGLIPFVRQPFDVESGLWQGARGTSRGLRRLQGSFVVSELALALALLAGAGLMMRTILSLWAVNPGFDSRPCARHVYRTFAEGHGQSGAHANSLAAHSGARSEHAWRRSSHARLISSSERKQPANTLLDYR
jgi:predicted permease